MVIETKNKVFPSISQEEKSQVSIKQLLYLGFANNYMSLEENLHTIMEKKKKNVKENSLSRMKLIYLYKNPHMWCVLINSSSQ